MQKYSYILLFCSSVFFFSCSTTRKMYTTSNNTPAAGSTPRFISGIGLSPGDRVASKNRSYGFVQKTEPASEDTKDEAPETAAALNTGTLQGKYSAIIGVPAFNAGDIPLLKEVDDWYGTPYRYGGNSKNGIDCSAFSRTFLSDVYNASLPRTAQEQYDHSRHIKKEQLQQGDLVFFHTGGRGITHVGVYLQNNKFVHASTSSGVMISDLDDYYWRKAYRAAGRVVDNDLTKN